MADIAIIGGTGLYSLKGLEIINKEVMHTPYGEPSGPLVIGVLHGKEVAFLPRHGYGHTIPPHKINYRANIWALKEYGVKNIIAVNAVGGITEQMAPPRIIIPDQIVDYTWNRVNTYFEEGLTHVTHIDFTHPYCHDLRHKIIDATRELNQGAVIGATYATTQGPRLETIAEVTRLERDGCDLVGMTGMPEASLARELDLCYAAICVVANWAAGKGDQAEITMKEIENNLNEGMEEVRRLLEHLIPTL